jgi:hypothetical protein
VALAKGDAKRTEAAISSTGEGIRSTGEDASSLETTTTSLISRGSKLFALALMVVLMAVVVVSVTVDTNIAARATCCYKGVTRVLEGCNESVTSVYSMLQWQRTEQRAESREQRSTTRKDLNFDTFSSATYLRNKDEGGTRDQTAQSREQTADSR